MSSITNLKYYVTQDYIYVNLGSGRSTHSPLTDLTLYQINGKFVEHTHHPAWCKVPDEQDITSLSRYASPTIINERFEIIDKEYVKDGVPPVLTIQEVGWKYMEDGYQWTNEQYTAYRRLYDYRSDTSTGMYTPIEFVATKIATLKTDDIKPLRVSYNILGSATWSNTIIPLDLSKVAYYGELDLMLQEPLLIHHSPCSISSKVAYDIIRQYIKENINSNSAIITSDYDFCFTVQRKIIIKPYTTTQETKKANGRSYATPKLRTYRHEHKNVELFEMTHDQKNYSGYTAIKGFCAENLTELAENIKHYLNSLMAHINTQFAECEHCAGAGVIVTTRFAKNIRT